MNYKLIDNDEAPKPRKARQNWPFAEMKIDQALVIDFIRDWPSACRAAYATGKRNGWKFRVKWYAKAVDEKTNEPAPYGKIWRVEE